MGRKTKLTPEITQQIAKYIEIGVPNKYAAQACGICEKTFYTWIEKAIKAKNGKYTQFLQSIKQAEAKSVVRDVTLIEKAAQEGKWQANAWRLERRHPNEFGNRQYLEHETKEPIKIEFEITRKREDETDSDTPTGMADRNKKKN